MPISSRGSPPAPASVDLAAARVYDLTWPDALLVGAIVAGGNASLNGIARHTGPNVSAFVATATPVYAIHKGRPCVSLPPESGQGMTSVPSFHLPLERRGAGELGPGALFARVLFDIAMAAEGGNNNEDTGLYFGVRASGVVNLPSISAYTFGLGRDGAGGWKFVASIGGDFSIEQAIAWPVAADEWCSGEYRLFPATKDAEARVELWLAGILTLSYAWGAGSDLPDYSGVSDALGFALAARSRDMGDDESVALRLAGLRFIQSTAEEA